MAEAFPGGVRDADSVRGFIATGEDRVSAVRLSDGALLWKREAVGQPIAASSVYLVTLDRNHGALAVRILYAASGTEVKHVTGLGLPEWVARDFNRRDALHVNAELIADGLRLDWSARKPYRGGAAPSASISAIARVEAAGSVFIDLKSGKKSDLRAGTEAAAAAPESSTAQALGPHASAIPGAVAINRDKDRLFVLRNALQQASTASVIIEARDAHTGATLWETPLTETKTMRPAPLRQ
jgi:hypothetical protein